MLNGSSAENPGTIAWFAPVELVCVCCPPPTGSGSIATLGCAGAGGGGGDVTIDFPILWLYLPKI